MKTLIELRFKIQVEHDEDYVTASEMVEDFQLIYDGEGGEILSTEIIGTRLEEMK